MWSLSGLRLVPGTSVGALVEGTHKAGEFCLDKNADLFLCTKGNPDALWVKFNVSQSFLPTEMKQEHTVARGFSCIGQVEDRPSAGVVGRAAQTNGPPAVKVGANV
jgi:hypothetical protein